MHSLLESNCFLETLEYMNNQPGVTRYYTRSDPEVQARAAELYQRVCQELGSRGIVSLGPEQEHFRNDRENYREGLGVLSRHISREGTAAQLPRSRTGHGYPVGPHRMLGASPMPESESSSIGQELRATLDGMQRLDISHFARSVPSVLEPYAAHPMVGMSRYERDFAQYERIGKGGYGEVFRVEHRLDGIQYAVKKIAVGESRVTKIQQRGQIELDALLNELRTLARLDHPNIVRYFNGWLEYNDATPSFGDLRDRAGNTRLLHDRPHAVSEDEHSEHPFSVQARSADGRSRSIDIVFERSDAGVDVSFQATDSSAVEDAIAYSSVSSERRRRSGTFSSTASRKSNATKASVEDEDIMMIPRDPPAVAGAEVSFLPSESSMLPSDTTGLAPEGASAPMLTLHLQMSLYPLTLADFLAYNSQFPDSRQLSLPSLSRQYQGLRHCFHTFLSLLIFLALLDGVEYLHSQGLVHRDLKPANIFLSLSDRRSALSSCIDRSSCADCSPVDVHEKASVYMNFRIGDFGLVASMANADNFQDFTAPHANRAVGTEHYRPPLATVGSADEKLDIFALGVILFELLWPFGTKMERHETLVRLKWGELPADFAQKIGSEGEEVSRCIIDMVSVGEASTLRVRDVRKQILRVVKNLEEPGT